MQPGSYLSEVMKYYALLLRRVTANIDCLNLTINWTHLPVGLIDHKVVVADLVVEEFTTMR